MPFIPAENVAMVEIRMTLDFQRVENTLYFEQGAGWDETSLMTLGEDVASWWEGQISPIASVALAVTEVTCTDLTSDSAPSVSFVPASLLSGVLVEEPLPNNCSLAISFRTAGRGRSSRGRNYFVGLVDNQVSGNEVTTGFADALKAAYLMIGLGGSFTADATWSVVSRHHNLAPRTTALVQPISSVVIVDRTIDSQRRRLPGRGR